MRRWLCVPGFVIAACARPADSSRTNSVRDSSGVQIVTSDRPRWDVRTAWRADTIPVTSIGGDESDPQQQFKFVRSATRMPNGEVVVVSDAELRWFGPDGKYLRTTARSGEGPGEFHSISCLARAAGDTLVASGDVMAQKVATFAPDGCFVRESRLDLEKWRKLGHWAECASGVLPDRSRLGCQRDPSIPESPTNRTLVPEDPDPGPLRLLYRYYVMPPSLDTAYRLGVAAGIEQFLVKGVGGRTAGVVIHPFYGSSFITAGGDPLRIVMATNPQYSIEIWTPEGKLERIIRRVNGRRAPTRQEKADAPAVMKQFYLRQHRDAAIDEVIAQVPVPDSLPAVVGLAVGPGGEVLVQREGWLPSQHASRFDLFDVNGQWLGELTLPARVRVLELGPDYLLGMVLDKDDVTRVEVYHLQK
jgi:hypothetical protein